MGAQVAGALCLSRRHIERVLVVDDEPAIVFALSEYLAVRGYKVDRASGLLGVDAFLHKPTPLGEIAQLLRHLVR